jgi:hypothetical protein
MLFHLTFSLFFYPSIKRNGITVTFALACSTLVSSCVALIVSQILSISFRLKTIKEWSPKLGILCKNDHFAGQPFLFTTHSEEYGRKWII